MNTDTSARTLQLRRVLSLSDLVFFGIVSVTPSAPVTAFGLALVMSRGHAVDTILIAMVAMLLTALSFGRMATVYPSAGSAYTYVSGALNAHAGFLTGWVMLLYYLSNPLVCTVFAALTIQRLVPNVPYAVWVVLFIGFTTFLNLCGIRATARTNQILLGIMFVVLLTFIGSAIRYVVLEHGWTGLVSSVPFYNPGTFDFHSIFRATAFAAITYGGFDAVTTLAEDAKNPRRNILLAIVLTCLFTGLFGSLLVYLGQLVWPEYQTFSNIDTAFYDMSQRAGGIWLFRSVAATLIVAMFGGALTCQVGAARLLFGMGRDNVLPRRIFAHLDVRKGSNPTFSILIVGVIALFGALFLSYELSAEVLNFGMFLTFMAVNLAAFRQFYVIDSERLPLRNAILPGLGFLFCTVIWWSLGTPARIAGGLWMFGGLTYNLVQTRGWRTPSPVIEFGES